MYNELEMVKILDAVIVGSGPAGLSAALNLKKFRKEFIWFGSRSLSEKVKKAPLITNYPGLPDISGAELFERFNAHILSAGLDITERSVTNILHTDTGFMILADNEMYESRTVILCTGVFNEKIIPGEEHFLGSGVSYCATCDGMLYRGKKIAVVCSSPKFEHEVRYLAELADTVYYMPQYRTADPFPENVHVQKAGIVSVCGRNAVESVRLSDGTELQIDGVFILRPAVAPQTLLPGIAVNDGHIAVERDLSTNIPGCFAAGDITGRPYQYAKAVGEGNIAAHSCSAYLADIK